MKDKNMHEIVKEHFEQIEMRFHTDLDKLQTMKDQISHGRVIPTNDQKLDDIVAKNLDKYVYQDLATFAMDAKLIARSKGQEITEKTIISALMWAVTEISEAANEIRDGNQEKFGRELAGAFCILAHIASSMKVNLITEIQRELLRSETRERHHGHVLALGKNLEDDIWEK